MNKQAPPDGIYLDAVLDEVRERTLDALDRKRHRRMPILIGTIIAGSLVVGTAAAALVVNHPWVVLPSEKTLYQLYCQQGNNINGSTGGTLMDPYYSASFYLPKKAGKSVEINPVAACKSTWTSAIAKWRKSTDPNDKFAANVIPISPAKLFANSSIHPVRGEMGAIFSPADYDAVTPPMATCVRPDEKGAAVYVISGEPGESHVTKRQWQVRCEINDGFVYQSHAG